MRKIFVIGGNTSYANWMQGEIVSTMEEADLVCGTGGEDCSPKLYQQDEHPTTYTNPARDKFEVEQWRKAFKLGKHCIGICRSAQMLCILANGDLIQDQPNPGYYHPVKLYDGQELAFTSTHHQAQYPFVLPEEEYKILGWTENMLAYHKNGWDEEVAPPKEVEICYYPEIKGLAIQPHIESQSSDSPAVLWLQDILNKFMNDQL